jgi:hypothetical protein
MSLLLLSRCSVCAATSRGSTERFLPAKQHARRHLLATSDAFGRHQGTVVHLADDAAKAPFNDAPPAAHGLSTIGQLASKGRTAHQPAPALRGPASFALYQLAEAALDQFRINQDAACDTASCMFSDVDVTLPLHAPAANLGNGDGQGRKAMINPQFIQKPCVVYGLGVAGDPGYEQEMSKYCEVHAFDCTVPANSPHVSHQPFHFHQLCIGREAVQAADGYKHPGAKLRFEPLAHVKRRLGHEYIDVLKFDVEGHEWSLFDDILADSANLPGQLQFELHTNGANREYVPQQLVRDKRKREVNRLFMKLHAVGYRVLSKEINNGDPYCAEFTLVRVAAGRRGEYLETE